MSPLGRPSRRWGSVSLSVYINLFGVLLVNSLFFACSFNLTRRSAGVYIAPVSDTRASGAMSSLESEVLLKV